MKVFDKRDETQKKKDASLLAMAIRGKDLNEKGRGRRGKSRGIRPGIRDCPQNTSNQQGQGTSHPAPSAPVYYAETHG